MTKKIKLNFVLFDLIGTTVQDANQGRSLILDSFHKAFAMNGFEINYSILNQERGKTKRKAIQNILTNNKSDLTLTDKIYTDFINLLNDSVSSFSEIAGTTDLFRLLKKKKIKIGLGSGLPLNFMNSIFQELKWDLSLFDYIGSSDELAEGRPNPIMILDARKKLGLNKDAIVLKIGDTLVDVKEGKNADVLTAMVLTGTQSRETLGNIVPDYIFDSVYNLMDLID